jgi:CDP-paratose 2-epimerase
MKVLVIGLGGLIGSEAFRFYLEGGSEVLGLGNNIRKYFFGEKGDTSKNIRFLQDYSKGISQNEK